MPYEPFAAGETITAEKMRTRFTEIIMDWTPLASLGSFASGFSANPGMAPAMQIVREMGVVQWRYQGRINNATPSSLSNTTTTMFTFASTDHRPIAERGMSAYASSSAHYPVRLGLMVSGNLTGSVPTAGGGAATIWLDGFVITNPR